MSRTVDVARRVRRSGALVAHLVTEDGQAYTLHFTAETAQLSGVGWSLATIDRQGLKPLVRRKAQQPRVLTFTHSIGHLDYAEREYANPTLAVVMLAGVADSGRKVRLINTTANIETRGWWYPQLQVTIEERDTEQQIKTATLSWTLTEVIDDRPKIARTPPPPPPPPKRPAPVVKAGQPDWVVKKGDSLWKIAATRLGSGTRWPEIYNLNKARLNLKPAEIYKGLLTVWIYPGQVMKVPPR